MEIELPSLGGTLAEALPLLFDLADDHPTGWVLAGAQMVVLHGLAHAVTRPVRTEDADVIVDIRKAGTSKISEWLIAQGFELGPPSPGGVQHRFHRDGVTLDVLSIDHTPNTSSRTTIPPDHTIEVPGGRRAVQRSISATVTLADRGTGTVPLPDWLGAVLLKARAVVAVPDQREKHAQDLALLLGLPVDLNRWIAETAGRDTAHIRRAAQHVDDAAWRRVAGAVDALAGKAALRALVER